jgi:RNA polymerase sigma factor (sigma-70 family)
VCVTQLWVDEANLIAAARSGDDFAYGQLYSVHWRAAVDAAIRLGCGMADAEDVAARAFDRVHVALRNDAGPSVSFRGYLMTAVRSAFLDQRSQAAERQTSPTDDAAQLDARVDVLEPESLSEEMARALSTLSPVHRQAILLRYDEGWSISELRVALGVPTEGAVSAVIGRARARLRLAYSKLVPATSDPSTDESVGVG